MPVGKSYKNQPYTTHEIYLEENDILLLTTDGFADQFGGDKGKKMKSSKLIQWIENNIRSNDTPDEIKNKLLHLHFEWKRNQEQTDDICMGCIKTLTLSSGA